jgi:hypothetical protein
MRQFCTKALGVCLLALLAGCGASEPPKQAVDVPKPAPPAIPTEITDVAESVLGSQAEVLAYGDLAENGRQQILVINRIPKAPEGTPPGILFTRAVIVENDDGKWKEIFRCDDHLKNTNGFLGGTPLEQISGWRLQFERDSVKGLQMYFVPMHQSTGPHPLTIAVRWDKQVKRYRSMDRTFENFLGEAPALEKLNSTLK